MSAFSYTTRLALPYALYASNPAESIRQLLGRHITIERFSHSDVILPGDTVIVDVTYQAIQLSPFRIYYVETKDVKPIIPDSDKYVVTINKCFVKMTIPNINDYPKIIPIRILSTLPSKTESIQAQFSYFGTIVTQPLSTLCTPIRYINHAYEPFDAPIVEPIYPSTYVIEKEVVDNTALLQTVRNYKSALMLHNILNTVTNVVAVQKFSECKPGTTGYVLPFSEIPTDHDIDGIILIHSKRIPEYIMFYPTSSCTICVEELESIKRLLEHDLINYNNFKYVQYLNKEVG